MELSAESNYSVEQRLKSIDELIGLDGTNLTKEDLSQAVLECLTEVGLPAYCSKSLPSALSGGMCQRAALAIAVAPQPQLVIADEPETGLDPILTRGVTELLLRVCVERGCGLLLISHQDETVERIGATIVRTREEGAE